MIPLAENAYPAVPPVFTARVRAMHSDRITPVYVVGYLRIFVFYANILRLSQITTDRRPCHPAKYHVDRRCSEAKRVPTHITKPLSAGDGSLCLKVPQAQTSS